MRGSALRPILSVLGADAPRFLEALAPRFRAAYPSGLLPFRRLFWVAVKR